MDMHHRLACQAIDIALNKAIKDIYSDSKRGIRNLVDLGLLFTRNDNQKWFFHMAKKVIASPLNPYNKLITEVINDVDHETVKTLGINLGYSSLIYGSGKLKKIQQEMEIPLPWMIIFDDSKKCSGFMKFIEEVICQGREMGIYCYVFRSFGEDEFIPIFHLAKAFEDCVFILLTDPLKILNQKEEVFDGVHNMIITVSVNGPDLNSDSYADAFRFLGYKKCFYGFRVEYDDKSAGRLASVEYIDEAIAHGNRFGIYVAKNASDECKKEVYNFVCSERGERGQSLVAFEWAYDIRCISEKISSHKGYLEIDSTDKIFSEYEKSEEEFYFSFIKMLEDYCLCVNI